MCSTRLVWAFGLCWTSAIGMSPATSSTYGTITKRFLPLPSMESVVSVAAGEAFANEHLTVMVGFPVVQRIMTGDPNASTNNYYSSQTSHYVNTTYTTESITGTIALAFNDTYYTHRWWPSVGDAIPNDSAFFDARCTASAVSASTWNCSSWSVTVKAEANEDPFTGIGYKLVTTNATNSTYTAMVVSENLYTIGIASIASMVVAPALSTASENATSTTVTTYSSYSTRSTKTILYLATQTSETSSNEPRLTTLFLLVVVLYCILIV